MRRKVKYQAAAPCSSGWPDYRVPRYIQHSNGALALASPAASPQRPTQAVILAGGRGTRLMPLTSDTPKAMIEFHGKPFLEYLIEMVRSQGFERILLLLGYRAEKIQEYFGDGRRWGISVEYSVSAAEDDTGRRLKLAGPRLDPVFLLMYCDNYWPMCLESMWKQFVEKRVPAMMTVYLNADGYTRNNVRVDADGYVVDYDKGRTLKDLAGVDLGFVLLRRSVVDLLSHENVSFEQAIYPRLVALRQLQAHVTEHRYYSVSTPARLPATDDFLNRRPTILLDRDGVLNSRMPPAEYVRSWTEWRWLSGSRDALRLLRAAGYRVIVISNQPGIARGTLSEGDLAEIHARMKAEAVDAGGEIEAVYHCPHGWYDGCGCRKPKPGLLYRAQRDFNLDLSRTFFIGDDERDAQAAAAAGCSWALVSPRTSLLDLITKLLDGTLREGDA